MSGPVVKSFVPQALQAVQAGTITAARETAIKVASLAKSLAPVDTGQLKGSIMWKDARSRTGLHDEGPKLSVTPPAGGIVVGTAVEHAVYQEFGTRKMPAKPYLRPAVSIVTEKSGYEKAVADAMEKTVLEKMRGVK